MKKLIITILVVGILFGSEFFITRNNIEKCGQASLCEVELTTDDWQTEHYWYYFDGRHDAKDLGLDVTYSLYSGSRRAVLMEKDYEDLLTKEELEELIALQNKLKLYTDGYFEEEVNVYFHMTSDITHFLYEKELVVAADIYHMHFDTWQEQLQYIIDTYKYADNLELDLSYIPQHGSSAIVGSNKTIDFTVVDGVLEVTIEQDDTDVILTEQEVKDYFSSNLDVERYNIIVK